jgi:hypothetical protein
VTGAQKPSGLRPINEGLKPIARLPSASLSLWHLPCN